MRALLASTMGAVSTAALLLPLALPAHAADGSDSPAPTAASPASDGSALPGSTQSLPLVPLDPGGADRASGAAEGATAGSMGLAPRTVERFSMVGMIWEEADAPLDARVQVRTRAAGTADAAASDGAGADASDRASDGASDRASDRTAGGAPSADGGWSEWHELDTTSEAAPGPAGHSAGGGPAFGATAPLWVGASDAVQVRVDPRGGELPQGLRLELVDPGEQPDDARSRAARSATFLPELTKAETEARAAELGLGGVADGAGGSHIGPRPGIVTRAGWGADVSLREGKFAYTSTVKMAFVHHTATSNGYRCGQAPSIIRGIYRYHVKSLNWRDLGYNFLIDKCGQIYEGRAGGVTEPVRGAHTYGFNSNSMGISVIGSYGKKKPSSKAVNAVAKLMAWKLGLYGVNPRGTTRMTSGGGKYAKGEKVKMNNISGHRDGYATECPGKHLYAELGPIRSLAAELQGR